MLEDQNPAPPTTPNPEPTTNQNIPTPTTPPTTPPTNTDPNNTNKPNEPVIPEKYDLSAIIADDQMDTEIFDMFSGVAKECKLTNEQAQELSKVGIKYGQKLLSNFEQAQEARIQEWGNLAKQELGAEFDNSVSLIFGRLQSDFNSAVQVPFVVWKDSFNCITFEDDIGIWCFLYLLYQFFKSFF